MSKKPILILFGIAVFLATFPLKASAAFPCGAANIRWAQSSKSVYVAGNVECTLTEIKQLGSQSIPLTLLDPANKIWFLGANLFIQNGAKIVFHGSSVGGDVDELRIRSNNTSSLNHFIVISADWGSIDINGVKVISWDESIGGPDTEYSLYGRAYIQARSSLGTDGLTLKESRMDIKNSDIGYLGYNGAEKYGLSWKVLGPSSVFNVVGVYGDVVNSKIHNNYFGAYTFGAQAMTFVNNEVYGNIKYGLDPHDDSDYLLIDSNYVHNNGNHGIICSQRCNNLTITNNTSSYNIGNGIMLHRNTNDSLVKNNELYNNTDSGISIFDSHSNRISDNISKYNGNGIRFSVGSSNNIVEGNNLSENSKFGMYFYKGTDIPTSGDGRVKSNTFRNNTVNANLSLAVSLKEADSNIFESNSFTGNGSYAIYLENTNNNIFKGNTLTGNALNYYYAKYISVNAIQDSDSFAIKIGDATSTMTITDSANAILKNSKSLSTNTYPSYSSIILTKTVASTSIVSFSRLNFTTTPSTNDLTIKSITWNTSGDFYKKWTAKNSSASAIDVSYLIGDLSPGTSYNVIVNGVLWNTFTSNGSGEISFVYNGVFQSTKTFEVKATL